MEHKATGRRPPHVLYTVPTGQNPTGIPILLAVVISPDVNFLFAPCSAETLFSNDRVLVPPVVIEPLPLYASSMFTVAGMVTTLERKEKIYQICSEHDIVIIEDDPYYYLQYSLGAGWPVITMSPLSTCCCYTCTHVTSSAFVCNELAAASCCQ